MASSAEPDCGPSFMDLAKALQARLQVMNNLFFVFWCFQNFVLASCERRSNVVLITVTTPTSNALCPTNHPLFLRCCDCLLIFARGDRAPCGARRITTLLQFVELFHLTSDNRRVGENVLLLSHSHSTPTCLRLYLDCRLRITQPSALTVANHEPGHWPRRLTFECKPNSVPRVSQREPVTVTASHKSQPGPPCSVD